MWGCFGGGGGGGGGGGADPGLGGCYSPPPPHSLPKDLPLPVIAGVMQNKVKLCGLLALKSNMRRC